MQDLPFQDAHVGKGKALYKEGLIGQIIFSSGTYQIEVLDPAFEVPLWPFIQLDPNGKLLDCFCSCSSEEATSSCPHLVCAFLAIFRGTTEQLSTRYESSLWNKFCQIAALRHGYEPSVLKKEKLGKYLALSETGKLLFSLEALTSKGKERLKEIIEDREVETEETSLKFSNLPIEEIALWKAGRPSHALKFELSFWSDLAKWWMLLQDSKAEYKISFSSPEEGGLPKWIKGGFADISFGFYISLANWSYIIPALSTVNSPLKVFDLPEGILKKITYEPLEKRLVIDSAPAQKKEGKEGLNVGDYIFVPSLGFYPKEADPLLKEKFTEESKLSLFFYRHLNILKKYLKGTALHSDPVTPGYKLFLDEKKALHIETYLFEEGDLVKPGSLFFPPWCFIEGKGFYLLDKPYFEEKEKIVPKHQVGEFVNRHRLWLQSFDGFQTHVSGIESHVSFKVSSNGSLYFESRIEESEELGDLVDFGEWIYIKDKGFYAKQTARSGSVLKPGIVIPREKVSSFIWAHKDELEALKGFFSQEFFLEKVGLNITINNKDQIVVSPEYHFKPPYTKDTVQVFGSFLYVEGKGFAENQKQFVLPLEYTEKRLISPFEEPYFVSYELDLLAHQILFLDPRLRKVKDLHLKVDSLKKEEGKAGWIAALTYQTEWGEVSCFDVWSAYVERKPYILSPAGVIFLKAERFNWFKGITKKKWLKKGKYLRLTTMEWLRLFVFEDLKEPLGDSKEAVDTRTRLFELREFQPTRSLTLEGLKSELRPYQELGLRWLWFIYTEQLSGLLCDEMGLGKTHQAMALLAAAFNSAKEKYLVVCPTSVIYHWEDLLKQFLPDLRVCVFYGSERSLNFFNEEYDLLLTSYGVLRSEKKALSKIHFEIAIFDELQVAKNAHSQVHKALSSLDAQVRIGLTGTPIENHIVELKALFDLILPGYFPQDGVFRDVFINPIEKYQDAEKKGLLSRLIKPFILRRKKKDVLLELPEKIEEIAYCPMSEEQKALYKEIYSNHKKAIDEELKGKEDGFAFGHVFSLISKLKQLCDHPALVYKNPSAYQKHQSGKWDLFVELLDEVRASGQKLVVFSQYLDMLDIIETHLKEKGWGFAGIRGSTQNRRAELEKFKNDPECVVFVASLQAAGVGIDLTSASVVIHYDRWWNPARENQATDRVHRMGQNRGVQVFKLVTRSSIEEHIHALIEKKVHLMESIVGFDEHDQVKTLNKEELMQLMQLLGEDAKD